MWLSWLLWWKEVRYLGKICPVTNSLENDGCINIWQGITPCNYWRLCTNQENSFIVMFLSTDMQIIFMQSSRELFILLLKTLKCPSFKKRNVPWLLWLSGWVPACKSKSGWFNSQSRAHAWVAGQVPSRGRTSGNHSMFLSLSSSLPLSKINKWIKS